MMLLNFSVGSRGQASPAREAGVLYLSWRITQPEWLQQPPFSLPMKTSITQYDTIK